MYIYVCIYTYIYIYIIRIRILHLSHLQEWSMLSFPWDQFLGFRLCTVMPDISKDIQTYPDISKNIQNLKIQTYPNHIQICEYSPVIVICTIIVFRRSLTTISNRKYQVCLVTYARLPLSCIGYIIFFMSHYLVGF